MVYRGDLRPVDLPGVWAPRSPRSGRRRLRKLLFDVRDLDALIERAKR